MPHKHEWEHLTTERSGDECAIKHGCEYCTLVMVTRLKFDGSRVVGTDVQFVDGTEGTPAREAGRGEEKISG